MTELKHVGAALVVLLALGAIGAMYDVIRHYHHRHVQRMMAEREAIARAGVEALPPTPLRDKVLDMMQQPGTLQRRRVSRILGSELRGELEHYAARARRKGRDA